MEGAGDSPRLRAGGELESGQDNRPGVKGRPGLDLVRREEELSSDVSKGVRIAPPRRHMVVEQEGREFSTDWEDSSGKRMVSLQSSW